MTALATFGNQQKLESVFKEQCKIFFYISGNNYKVINVETISGQVLQKVLIYFSRPQVF
jgi:hypothetical protein